MDEMTGVRDLLYADLSPQEDGMVAARARLAEAMAGNRPAPRRRRVVPLRWSLAGTGVLAAAVAAALALGSGPPPPAQAPPAPAQALTAQQFLLAAAERAERAPATSGRYWRVKWVMNATFQVPAGYNVTQGTVMEEWTGIQNWSGSLRLGAHPSTPADEAAWRSDGSPTEWKFFGRTVLAAPERAKLIKVPNGGTYLGENEVTLAEIRQLPTNPEQLRAWLERRIWAQGGIDSEKTVRANLFGAVVNLLATTPASPALRAAAFRLLAATPGVRIEGEVRDQLGRVGTRVVYNVPDAEHTVEMVIDPDGPQVLASDSTAKPATGAREIRVAVDSLYITAEWTDSNPIPPTAP